MNAFLISLLFGVSSTIAFRAYTSLALDAHWHALRAETPAGSVLGAIEASDPDGDILLFRVINSTAGKGLINVESDGKVILASGKSFEAFDGDEVKLSIGVSDGKDESVFSAAVSLHDGHCMACATVVEEIHDAIGERIAQSKISNFDARAAFNSMNFTDIIYNICERRKDLLMTEIYRDTCLHLAKKKTHLLVQAFSGRLKPRWSETLNHKRTFKRIASLCNITVPYCRSYLPENVGASSKDVFKLFKKDKCRRCATVADDLQTQYDRVMLRTSEIKVAQEKQKPERMSIQALRSELRDKHKQDTHGMRRDLERRLKLARKAQMEGRARVRRDPLSRGTIVSFLERYCASLRARHFPALASNLEYTCEDLVESYEDDIVSILLDRQLGEQSSSLTPYLCHEISGDCSMSQLKDPKAAWIWSPWIGSGTCFSKEMASKLKPLLVGSGAETEL